MSFFAYEYDEAVKFDMYTPMHILMLVLFLVMIILFILFQKKIFQSSYEKEIRYGYAVFLIILEILLIYVQIAGGAVYLPFHLCAISYLLTIYLLFSKNEKVFDFVFFTGIIGGIVSFAIPDLHHAGYNRYKFYQFILAHGSIILVPIYFFINYQFEITKKKVITAIISVIVLGVGMLGINGILRLTDLVPDANYMFTFGPPPDVEAVFGVFPWHLLSFIFVLLVTFYLLYIISNKFKPNNT